MPDYISSENLLPTITGVRHRFITVRGIRLHFAETGEPGVAPVVLLHGFPQHWYMWRDVMPLLGPDRHVIALDLRGFGWSAAPRRGYSTPDRVADVVAVLDHLGIDRADVVGHDWGAWLGFRVALEHPSRVRRLVSISMVHPWVMQRHLIPNVWRWWVTTLFEIPGVGERVLRRLPRVTSWLLARDAVRTETWTPALRDTYASVSAEPARALAGRRLHGGLILRDIPRLVLGRDRGRTLDVPTLIIGGENDALLPPAVLTVPARLAGRIEVRTIPGGHYLVDENPELVATLLDGHLR